MQFTFDEDQAAVGELARDIFTDRATVDRLVEIQNQDGFDADLWKVLADSGLLGVAVPEEHGGSGLGLEGLVALLEEQGRRVAPVPLVAAVAGAALPLSRFGTDEQRERWLDPLLAGTQIAVGAFETTGGAPAQVRASADGDGWLLTGEVALVQAVAQAQAVLVPALLPDGNAGVFIVATDQVSQTPLQVSSWESASAVRLEGVHVEAAQRLGADGDDVIAWTRRRLRVALAALAIGICAEDVKMTAEYTSQREQFGRPLSTNQAVTFRMADAHLDTEAIRLTTYRAASLLDQGLEEDGDTASLVAKWWVGKGAVRVTWAAQQLHGGLGGDVEYPIHRYFLWARQAMHMMGTSAQVAAELGDVMAARRPQIGAAAG